MIGTLSTALQIVAIVLVGLVAGSMFGIWRGYDPAAYAPATFVEVHQGAVRGLNTLLPAMAGVALVLTIGLAVLARSRPVALWAYLGVVLLVAIGGVITRFANQPINDQVAAWTAATMPGNWTSLRDNWWTWHIARLAVTLTAEVLLILAVFADRDAAAAAGS